jgi:Plasmid pRiA4b ORF-3-like protein
MNMRTSKRNAKGGDTAVVYRLKVTLRGSKPPIWRRVLVSGNERLDRVHMILNCAMGWTDTHLHAFEIGGTRYSVPDPEGLHDDKDERRVRLVDLPLSAGSVFDYWYDFGDGWEHRVLVESIEPADRVATVPACEGGRRACPPEDIGGAYGYVDFLKSPERWGEYGPAGFDPDSFDADEINEALRRFPSGGDRSGDGVAPIRGLDSR